MRSGRSSGKRADFVLESAGGGYRFATRPEHDPVEEVFFKARREPALHRRAGDDGHRCLPSARHRARSVGDSRRELNRSPPHAAGAPHDPRRRPKSVVGSPFLYRTTREFLVHFGLEDIRICRRLEEFGEMLGEVALEELIGPAAGLPGEGRRRGTR